MQYCDYCGAELVGAPVRRRGHAYCSKTCAEEHELEVAAMNEDEDADPDEEPEDEEEGNGR